MHRPPDSLRRPFRVTKEEKSGTRTDIQALRAIAVSLVLIYHMAPWRVPGGFVGVDVFFVISGYLITTHLLSAPPSRVKDLFAFWSRRIRRLLPASLLVLAVSLLVTRLAAPQTLWLETAQQVRAAALYAVNWNLANQHVDYLSPAQPPTAVQHFWSLSVEEQFYLGWPILLLLLFLLGRALKVRGVAVAIVGITVVLGVSLAWSISETASDPSAAYFVTPTRIWELATGGLLAAIVVGRGRGLVRRPLARTAVSWLGLAGIAWTALEYTDATPFPSWRALLPVLATAAVIAGHAPRTAVSPAALMALRPVQYLGDISYSVYLWHWPLIILLPSVLDRPRDHTVNALIIVLSVVLAALTKWLIEDRFRTSKWGRPLVKPFALAAVVMAAVVLAAQLQENSIQEHRKQSDRIVAQAVQHGKPCFGAAALDPNAPADCVARTKSGTLTPSPLEVKQEASDVWHKDAKGKNCFAHPDAYAVVTCHFGDPKATTSVALVGNSHMAQWLPAIRIIAAQRHWRLTTYVAVRCALVDVHQTFPTGESTAKGCDSWNKGVLQRVAAGSFDMIVMSNLRLERTPDGSDVDTVLEKWTQGYERTIKAMRGSGAPVAVIEDTPFPATLEVANCLAKNPDDYYPCGGTRAKWLKHTELTHAVQRLDDPGVKLINMNDYLCIGTVCPGAIGRVPVYFDNSHLTKAYAQTLAPYLSPRLAAVL